MYFVTRNLVIMPYTLVIIYIITKTQILISVYYIICRYSDTLHYFAKLKEKDKFLCENITNVNNQRNYYKSFYIYELTNYI